MNSLLMLEQGLNGLQFGLMLFLLAAGSTFQSRFESERVGKLPDQAAFFDR